MAPYRAPETFVDSSWSYYKSMASCQPHDYVSIQFNHKFTQRTRERFYLLLLFRWCVTEFKACAPISGYSKSSRVTSHGSVVQGMQLAFSQPPALWPNMILSVIQSVNFGRPGPLASPLFLTCRETVCIPLLHTFKLREQSLSHKPMLRAICLFCAVCWLGLVSGSSPDVVCKNLPAFSSSSYWVFSVSGRSWRLSYVLPLWQYSRVIPRFTAYDRKQDLV